MSSGVGFLCYVRRWREAAFIGICLKLWKIIIPHCCNCSDNFPFFISLLLFGAGFLFPHLTWRITRVGYMIYHRSISCVYYYVGLSLCTQRSVDKCSAGLAAAMQTNKFIDRPACYCRAVLRFIYLVFRFLKCFFNIFLCSLGLVRLNRSFNVGFANKLHTQTII